MAGYTLCPLGPKMVKVRLRAPSNVMRRGLSETSRTRGGVDSIWKTKIIEEQEAGRLWIKGK